MDTLLTTKMEVGGPKSAGVTLSSRLTLKIPDRGAGACPRNRKDRRRGHGRHQILWVHGPLDFNVGTFLDAWDWNRGRRTCSLSKTSAIGSMIAGC